MEELCSNVELHQILFHNYFMFWSLDGKIDEMKNEEHQRLDDLEFIVEVLEKEEWDE